MKKKFLYIAAMIASLCACTEENLDRDKEQDVLTEALKVSIVGIDTRTLLDFDGKSVLWTEGDVVRGMSNVQNAPAVDVPLKNISGSSAVIEAEIAKGTTDLIMAYPTAAVKAYSFAEGNPTVTLELSAFQTAVEGGFANNSNIAVAYATKVPNVPEVDNVVFNNICGLIRFTVPKSLEETASEVTFTNNGGTPLAGAYTVNPMTMEGAAGEGSASLTMTGTFEAGKSYCFLALPTQINGFTITMKTPSKTYSVVSDRTFAVASASNKDLGMLQFTGLRDYYNLEINLDAEPVGHYPNQCNEITRQADGSWFVNWDRYDAYFYMDILLSEEEKELGADFSKYYMFEFEVRGAANVENTPLIVNLGNDHAWPNYCSDCKNFIPVSEDWVKVSCNLMEDVPNKDAMSPWTWIRMGVGANAHAPEFYIRNIRLRKYDEALDGPLPPMENPEYYELEIRDTDRQNTDVFKQDDGSWLLDWHWGGGEDGTGGNDAFFYLDIKETTGVDFDTYNVLEFDVRGATLVENTPLIMMLGGFAWPNYCSDCKNFIPVSEDWVKVSCNLMEDVPNKAAVKPWTWIRVGVGGNAHTPTFYLRNVRLLKAENQ